jgi:hypothetical protein
LWKVESREIVPAAGSKAMELAIIGYHFRRVAADL